VNTEQFIREKNKLVFRVTENLLVPTNQIVNEPKVELDEEDNLDELGNSICPYCMNRKNDGRIVCSTCPMHLGKNECGFGEGTWDLCNKIWSFKATDEDKEELRNLVEEYNEHNKD